MGIRLSFMSIKILMGPIPLYNNIMFYGHYYDTKCNMYVHNMLNKMITYSHKGKGALDSWVLIRFMPINISFT